MLTILAISSVSESTFSKYIKAVLVAIEDQKLNLILNVPASLNVMIASSVVLGIPESMSVASLASSMEMSMPPFIRFMKGVVKFLNSFRSNSVTACR